MPTGKTTQAGFTYLFVLMMIALIGMGLAAAGTLWHTESQREREAELLFVGNQYRQAIKSYYENESKPESDKTAPRLPQSINDLLQDNRRPDIVRHLRRAYRDPFTGKPLALILASDNKSIVGVFSEASGHPFKTGGFVPEFGTFNGADSYADWRFEFVPPAGSNDKAVPAAATAASPAEFAAAKNAQTSDPAPVQRLE